MKDERNIQELKRTAEIFRGVGQQTFQKREMELYELSMLSGALIPPHVFDHLNELLKRNFEPAVIAKVILLMCNSSRRVNPPKSKETLGDKYNSWQLTSKATEVKAQETRKTPLSDSYTTTRREDVRRAAKISHNKQAAKADSPVGLALAFKMRQTMEEKKEKQPQSIDLVGIRKNLASYPSEDI
ncbi:unnamed protein product [Dimorphilus gyrociliatus]|uniref:Uncharacterized protein n=1 Tax=Dimorphilus gyrociliatus TaxID=2664684 RepID=A0A7I8WCZ2_9ANNE|nr:unnamed protein product [Dimorphilus gyrociliatus]